MQIDIITVKAQFSTHNRFFVFDFLLQFSQSNRKMIRTNIHFLFVSLDFDACIANNEMGGKDIIIHLL